MTYGIENKSILVIGGAGSIGSSFIKAILPFKPKSLVVDINENGLAELTRNIRSTENLYVPDEYIPYPINFSDPVFEKMFCSHRGFDIVAKFSAHKHVRNESGEICMLACILGENREIFFPKLEKESMMTFSEIAERLLTSFGYSIKKCTSENEALSYTKELENGSHEYPVYFTASDTTGEKAFEEFFTQNETINLSRFKSLGIVQNVPVRDKKEIETLFSHLKTTFNSQNCTKNDIVKILKNFLPNFEHQEKNKSLDAKM